MVVTDIEPEEGWKQLFSSVGIELACPAAEIGEVI